MKSGEERRPKSEASPIFVIGNPRSGTTLLRLAITTHSEITIPPESAFIVSLFPKYGHIRRFSEGQLYNFLSDLGGCTVNLPEQWEVSPDALFREGSAWAGQSYADVCGAIYRAYNEAKQLPPTPIWGDKNNAHANYIDVLSTLYPQAKFVHIVRDGRAVLASYQALKINPDQKYAPILPKSPALVAAMWSTTVDRIDRHLNRFAQNRHTVMRYEDILTDFNPQMKILCEFLNVPFEDQMIRFHVENQRLNLEPKSFNWKENARNPLDSSRAAAWHDMVKTEDIAVFEACAGEILNRHGYDTQSGSGSKGVPMRYRLEAHARESLRALRRQFVTIRRALKD